jgi:hypothetical protein
MPAKDEHSLIERVQSSYQQLSETATALNTASDELGKPISALDAALKKLNLGVEAWVRLERNDDHNTGSYWSRDVGYAKVAGKWGIAISTTSGNYNWPDEEKIDLWLFNDAPRTYRIEAVEKIPDLIEKLIEAARDATDKIVAKSADAKRMAEALAPFPYSQPRRK